jgi:hypothetical protein
MKASVLALALLLAGLFAAEPALAQRDRGDDRRPATMSKDQRQRMREDMREVYRERGAERGMQSFSRPERPRQLTPEERAKLRRDVQDANRDLRR